MLLAFMPLFFVGCTNNAQTKSNGLLAFHPQEAETAHKIKTVPITLENSHDIGAAFLAPSDWQTKGNIVTEIAYTVNPLLTIEMQSNKGNSKILFKNTPRFIDFKNRDQFFMTMPTPNEKPLVGVDSFYKEYFEDEMKNQYNFIGSEDFSQKIVGRQIFNWSGKVYRFVSKTDPQKYMDIYLQLGVAPQGNTGNVWHVEQLWVERPENEKESTENAALLLLNTLELNPSYVRLCVNVIQQMTAANRALYLKSMQLNKDLNDQFFNTLHSIQNQTNATINSTSDQFSDMMLGVTTYTMNDGNDIKLPTQSEYTFTNDLGDFITTDNPLFDPNSQLNSLHNWNELQKKYQ